MKIQIDRADLTRGLSRVQAVVERRVGLPILSNALLRAEAGRLTLSCTDLEVGITSEHECQVTSPGSVTLAAKKLFEIVRELDDAAVTMQTEKDARVRLECGGARFALLSVSAEEYPTLPSAEGVGFVEIDASLLAEMIDRTLFATSTDETRYHLNGVYIERTPEGKLVFVATDGHRMPKTEKPAAAEVAFLGKGIIVPRKGMAELRKLCEETDGMVELGLSENFLLVRRPGLLLSCRLIDAEYPNWRGILPSEYRIRVLVEREPFLRAVRRVSLLAHEHTGSLRLALEPGKLLVSASNANLGEAREEIALDYDGDRFETGFNARYMSDALGAMDSKEVYLELTTEVQAASLRPADDLDYVSVVMPMRL
jgi:DNA polymerase-3 subunit beta